MNTASKTMSDDWHILIAACRRLDLYAQGVMPSTQGNPNRLNDKILFGLSGSINVRVKMRVPMIPVGWNLPC